MFVACSTLCFAGLPLEAALRRMIEMEFNKVDLALHAGGPHLTPEAVAADVEAALLQIRSGPSLTVAALDLDFGPVDAETLRRQFAALCRFAKGLMVAVLTIPAAPRGTPLAAEAERLAALAEVAGRDGLVLALATGSDTLTADPADALRLCQAVPGLGLALDPSPYVNGPCAGADYDALFPFVRNVHLRDTGRKPGEYQVRVGQGLIEYGRIVNLLERADYDRGLTVAIHERPDSDLDVELEVRKLKLLLESLL